MAIGNITAAFAALKTLSANNGITVEQAVGTVEDWEKMRTNEQMTMEEKRQAKTVYVPQIAQMFEADPNADLDPAEVASRLGMPDKQGVRSFVRHQIKLLRLTYANSKNGAKVAAD
jgi:hypothetical protein